MDAMSSATNLEKRIVRMATQQKVPLGGSLELLPLCNMNCDMCYVRISRDIKVALHQSVAGITHRPLSSLLPD